ncbi:MAG: adenylate/guanylate cyclase domain-containing protein [Chlamydiae bacterium]|nr:adenylate/guanylate cyclase domain-containing protein [Chlamydiota bacterium]MBI3267070.1 adenylate/guanylate cyclase domain-containing protein [Chlamydiota bacterium]
MKRGFAIAVLSFTVFSFLSQGRFIRLMELKGLDVKFFFRGLDRADSRLMLVGIDDGAIKVLGRWPWSRSYHAALLQVLSQNPPLALGFDILFEGADTAHPSDDHDFAQMSRLFDTLTYASYFRMEKTWGKPLEDWQIKIVQKNELSGLTRISSENLSLRAAQELEMPYPELAQNGALGFINVPRDVDGSIRRIPLLVKYGDQILPSFTLKLIMQYYNLSGQDVELLPGPFLKLKLKEGPLLIPIDREGDYLVNFRSGLDEIRSYRFDQVLKRKKVFPHAIVVVGFTATGVADVGPTPLSPNTPLVMVHFNALQNILQRDFIKIVPLWAYGLMLFGLCLVTSLVSCGAEPLWAALGSLAILMVFTVSDFVLFGRWNVQLPWVISSLAILGSYLISTTHRFWTEEKEKRYVKKAFQHYVSRAVMERVLKDPQGLALGGKREELTVLFSDIQNFSSYCERKTPEEVISILNEYFDAMTQIILECGGTLDKYLGDGLMAIFGAPLPLFQNHAVCAVNAAYQMQKKLKELQQNWKARGHEPFSIGVGVNTGWMVVGNVGSSHVMNYTVLGDEVNLAARLEGLTRSFDVPIVISQATNARVENHWETRFLGETKVKGMERSVAVYEVIDKKGSKV